MRKINVIIALSIFCSLLLSQVTVAETSDIMAASTATTGASTVTTKAPTKVTTVAPTKVTTKSPTQPIATTANQEVQKKQPEEVKTKISKEQATKIIKSFKFAKGRKLSDIYLEKDSQFNQPIWKMAYSYSTEWGVSISANTGELLGYQSYSYQKEATKKNIITITKKKAKEIADKFLADYIKIDTKRLEYLSKSDNVYPVTGNIYDLPEYVFTYALKVNDIRTSDVYYTIHINATNGKVANFLSPEYKYLKETKYPATEGVKDLNELRDKYISLLGMQLQYRIAYNDKYEAKAARLEYIPTAAGWLDAKTMDIVDADYINYYGNVASLTNKYNPINPDAKIENKEINEKDAMKIIKNAKAYVEGVCDFKFNNNPQFPQSTTEKEVSSYYDLVNDNKDYRLSMSLNLYTGNIRRLEFDYKNDTNNSNRKEVVENVNYIAAKKLSDEIIKNLFEKQYGVFSDNNQEPDASNQAVKVQQNHIFQYTRYENGIPTDNTIRVCIDKKTGKPSSVNMSWNDIDFPKADSVVSEQAAKEAFLNYIELALEYYIPRINRTEALDKAEEAVIVFKPHDSAMNTYIDACTGKIVDYLYRKH